MSLTFRDLRSANLNDGLLGFTFEMAITHLFWSCSDEYLEDPNVLLTLGYLNRHRDGRIFEQLFIQNEEQAMMAYFDAENEDILSFIIYYFQNEYALLLSKTFREDKNITLPETISFKIIGNIPKSI